MRVYYKISLKIEVTMPKAKNTSKKKLSFRRGGPANLLIFAIAFAFIGSVTLAASDAMRRITCVERTLAEGSNHTCVIDVEKILNASCVENRGVGCKGLSPNQIYKSDTTTQMRVFQKRFGVYPSGKVAARGATWRRLCAVQKRMSRSRADYLGCGLI
jgi:hypothetical protein